MWETKKLLIWGTTYPEFSTKHYETVCTGAIDASTGKLIRIYPITLRYKKEPFRLYDWVEAEIQRNTSDFRPESFKIQQDTIRTVDHLETKDGWAERSKWVLNPGNIYKSVEALRNAEAADHTSLGLVKPAQILDIYAEKRPESDRREWEQHRERALAQKELFVDAESETKDLAFMPVRYRIKFRCDDPACVTTHDLSVLDWGLYVLSRRQFAQRGGSMAERDCINRLRDITDPSTKDVYFFLGNSKAHCHNFMITGIYYPPIKMPQKAGKGDARQGSLF